MNQKEITTYLRQMKRACPYRLRKRLIGELKSDLLDYLEQNPDSTLEEVREHFGSPETLSQACALNQNGTEYDAISRSKRIKQFVLIGVIIAVLFWMVLLFWMKHDHSGHVGYYYEEDVKYTNMEGSGQ